MDERRLSKVLIHIDIKMLGTPGSPGGRSAELEERVGAL
jgi:hypothetical protein